MMERMSLQWPVDGFACGADWNPDQWPREVWQRDLQLMQAAGVNLVTLPVFSWALLEPEAGCFDFAWLDEILDATHEHGISVDLATATATPPAWLVRAYPEVLPVNIDGVRLEYGSRQSYCPNSPVFRAAVARLAEAMARRYAAHPALKVWHISNEYGDHISRCYCDNCAAGFRSWLRARYGDIDALNAAWGTTMWGQRYGNFDEVMPPRRTMAPANPTHTLDFARFATGSITALYEVERDILRRLSPGVPVLTNFMTVLTDVDYWQLAPELDIVAFDNYPDPADPLGHLPAALNYGIMRSLAGRRPWMLLESAPSAVSWRAHNVPKADGQNRAHAFQAVAHGSDAVMYFQWRASRVGAERFHSAIVGHHGEDSRTLHETSRIWRELGALKRIAGSCVRSSVALVVDWESRWAMVGPETMPSNRLTWIEQLRGYHAALAGLGLAVDAVHPHADLSAYALVVAPSAFLLDDRACRNLSQHVDSGGHLVVGPFSGVVDGNNHVHAGGAPGPLRDTLGIRVEEPWPVSPAHPFTLRWNTGEVDEVPVWAEYLHIDEGTEILARYGDGALKGRPAVTRRTHGSGSASYVSAVLTTDALVPFLRDAAVTAGIPVTTVAASQLEVVTRTDGTTDFVFVINHGDHPQQLRLPADAEMLLSDASTVAEGMVELGAYGIAVFETPSGATAPTHIQRVEARQ